MKISANTGLGKATSKIKENEEFFALIIAIAAFASVLYSSFSISVSEKDISNNYSDLVVNVDRQYSDYTKNSNAEIKKILDARQIREMKYYKERPRDKSFNKRENPFLKSF